MRPCVRGLVRRRSGLHTTWKQSQPNQLIRCMSVCLFPGQGSQHVGMCQDLAQKSAYARLLFNDASDILGYDLYDRCVNGPKEVLNSTEVCQPAMFVASMAASHIMTESERAEVTATAGLSLGEYSALCFAGAFSFDTGVRLTEARGKAMQAAADQVDSGMVTVSGLTEKELESICNSLPNVSIANKLTYTLFVLSGLNENLEQAITLANECDGVTTTRLAVAGAFHTQFMSPASDALQEILDEVEISTPQLPVISNVTAQPHSSPSSIRRSLLQQLTSPVLWDSSMQYLLSTNFDEAWEVGPGSGLSAILKKINRRAKIRLVNP